MIQWSDLIFCFSRQERHHKVALEKAQLVRSIEEAASELSAINNEAINKTNEVSALLYDGYFTRLIFVTDQCHNVGCERDKGCNPGGDGAGSSSATERERPEQRDFHFETRARHAHRQQVSPQRVRISLFQRR